MEAIQRDPELLNLAKWDFERTNDSMWKHFGQIWDMLRKSVMNSFIASVEKHAKGQCKCYEAGLKYTGVCECEGVTNGKGIKL